jgi:pimeloyl-ACP methyl ester carboxylesterase
MAWNPGVKGWVCVSLAGLVLSFAGLTASRGDSVIMKNGIVYRSQGAPDRDNTLLYISDGLKRVVVRDSKVERIDANNAFRTGEKFQLVQPMSVHGGIQPDEVISVKTGPWNERGRRPFEYVSRTSKPIRMEQAIIEIGPHVARFRGVDGFWVGQVDINQVPHESVMALLRRVEQKNADERERVVRFLMDVGWRAEARQELDRLVKDFPEPGLKERVATALQYITQLDAERRRSEIDVSRKAQQYRRVAELLKSFNQKGLPTQLLVEVRDVERRDIQQRAADQAMAEDLRKLGEQLPSATRTAWKERLVEVLKAIDAAPEAVRDRLAAWRKARSQSAGSSSQNLFALAMSGYVAGHELAAPDLKTAEMLWKGRELVRSYLTANDQAARSERLAQLDGLDWGAVGAAVDMGRRLQVISQLIQLMPPLWHDAETDVDKTKLHRVHEPENDAPTEYAVRLPPEYDPLRAYPAVIVMHSGDGPNKALDQWETEAARRGYILIAPEYTEPGKATEYRYTTSEHAAVELALRDARKRYSIDSDRVFAAGQLGGANMAWDYALAHPAEFAGVVVISGLPAKYVPRYLPHHERVPLFYVIGEYVPAASKFIYEKFVKPLILKTWDITYVEYFRRGLEELPEEISPAYDWMDRHRRDPYPKAFKAFTARTSDDRFYGIVVRDFSPGRTTAPEAADVLGQNLNPATIEMKSSRPSNLIRLEVSGIKSLDVWLNPKLIDFKRRVEVRIHERPYFKALIKLDAEPMLEDLRIRGDRQQLYWYRISAH